MKRALRYVNQHLSRRRIYFAQQKFERETAAPELTMLNSTLDGDQGRAIHRPEEKQSANEKY